MEQTETLVRNSGASHPQEWLDTQVRTPPLSAVSVSVQVNFLRLSPLCKAFSIATVTNLALSHSHTPLPPATWDHQIECPLSIPHPQGLPSLSRSRSSPWGDLPDQPTTLHSCSTLPQLDDPHVSLSCLLTFRTSLHRHPVLCSLKVHSSFWVFALLQSPAPPNFNRPHSLERTLEGCGWWLTSNNPCLSQEEKSGLINMTKIAQGGRKLR